MERKLIQSQPGLRVHYWIGDLQCEFDCIVIDPVIGLLGFQLVAMRTARVIDPAFRIQTQGFDYECVIIRPFAYGVSVPARVGVVR